MRRRWIGRWIGRGGLILLLDLLIIVGGMILLQRSSSAIPYVSHDMKGTRWVFSVTDLAKEGRLGRRLQLRVFPVSGGISPTSSGILFSNEQAVRFVVEGKGGRPVWEFVWRGEAGKRYPLKPEGLLFQAEWDGREAQSSRLLPTGAYTAAAEIGVAEEHPRLEAEFGWDPNQAMVVWQDGDNGP